MNFYLQLSNDLRYIMRISLSQLILIVILTGVSYASETIAQGVLNNPVQLKETTTTLHSALKKIEKASDVKFVYSRNMINTDQIVSVSAYNEKLSTVLDELLESRGIKYEVINKQIVLSPLTTVKETAQNSATATQQSDVVKADINVTGRVTDSKGEALIGVTVKLKGNTLGVTTNVTGDFSINIPDNVSNPVLVFSYIGFTSQEVAVNGRTRINVQLLEDSRALDEVVVVGYGTQKKSDVTGATSRVGTAEIEQMPVQNALQALQGRAAGVDITSNARPGEIGIIRIRGNRSLKAGNEPLYVVDGIPLEAGGIEAISPHDIESIDILKDASSTAIYGSRGANGVVLVTTKRGKAGKSQITYNGISTFETLNDLDEVFNAGEYADYRRNAYRAYPTTSTSRYSTPYPNPVDDKRILGLDPNAWESIAAGYTWVDKANLVPQMRATTAEEQAKWGVNEVPVYNGSAIPTTNWGDYVTQTGMTNDHTLSVGMGAEKLSAYLSGGYLDQVGTNKGQDYKRYSLKASLDLRPNDWFSFGGSINGTWGTQNYGYAGSGSRGANGIYAAARGMLPFAVPYDANGEYIYLPGSDVNIVNPILEHKYVINERTTLRALGSFYAEAKILKGLRYRVNFGPDFRNYRIGQFRDKRSVLQGAGAATAVNYARLQQTQNFAWTLDNLLYYDKTLADIHKFDFTLLQSSSFNRNENSSMEASDLPYDSQLWYNLGSTSKGKLDGYGSGYTKNTLFSYMGRVNYSLFDRYLITASARWDGASQLADGNKWDFFPSVALGWKMEQESFMKDISWISQLKPRFGIGVTGTSSVNAYSTLGGLTLTPIVFGNQVSIGYIPSDPAAANPALMPNKNLGWEKTTQWNLGVDFGLLGNRITGNLDFYSSKTNDLLMDRAIPSVNGYTRVAFNVGKTQNKGFDLTLSSVNLNKGLLKWNTDFSLSSNKDEIVELYNGKNDAPELNFFIGQPLFVFYDYEKIGIWQTSDAVEMAKFNANGATYKAGDIRVKDLDGDDKIDANNDRKVIGNRFPKWTSGLTNTFNYKNWELSFFVYARTGFTIEGGAADMQGRYQSRKVDYWTVDNPTNEFPRADYSNGGQPIHYSAMNYQDGTFVKVKNISAGYSVPSKYTKKAYINNLKGYVQVLNPFLYTKNGFIDPDIFSSVSSRSFVLGLNASF